MTGLFTSGPDFFPGWVSIVFTVGLAVGLVHHLPCVIHGHSHRWFHAGHAAMALSMIYMYLSMSYDWNWLPATWQLWFFVGTSMAVTAHLLTQVVRGQAVNLLWLLLLVQQAAMVYMWFPMMRWNAILIFTLVSWFAIEAFGWAADLLPDDVRATENRVWIPYELPTRRAEQTKVPATAASARGLPVNVAADDDRCRADPLILSDWKDRTSMAIMALSMGYMFYGMELMH